MLLMAYCILYCTRPKGVKHLRVSAVNSIRHQEHVVISTYQTIHDAIQKQYGFNGLTTQQPSQTKSCFDAHALREDWGWGSITVSRHLIAQLNGWCKTRVGGQRSI